jgi:hypothetical protein
MPTVRIMRFDRSGTTRRGSALHLIRLRFNRRRGVIGLEGWRLGGGGWVRALSVKWPA